jgi:hypothetical protein
MPNYATTFVTISGDFDERQRFMEQASMPYLENWAEGRTSDGLMTAESKRVVTGDFLLGSFVAPTATDLAESNWYEWNNDNWGTKWEAEPLEELEQCLVEQTLLDMTYAIQTPWCAPEAALVAMSQQYPSLTFQVRESEECVDYRTEYLLVGGKKTVVIPVGEFQSHEEKDHFGILCMCQDDEYLEECGLPYGDCPGLTPMDYFEVKHASRVGA